MPDKAVIVDGCVVGNGVEAIVSGPIDFDTVADLEATLRSLMVQTTRMLDIDMSECTFFDSTGMRLFVSLDSLMRNRAGGLTLHRPSPIVRRILEVTGLTGIRVVDQPLTSLPRRT